MMISLSSRPVVASASAASRDLPLILSPVPSAPSPSSRPPLTTRPSLASVHFDAPPPPASPSNLSPPSSPSPYCRYTLSPLQGPVEEGELSDEEGKKLRASASPAQLAYFGALSSMFEETAEESMASPGAKQEGPRASKKRDDSLEACCIIC